MSVDKENIYNKNRRNMVYDQNMRQTANYTFIPDTRDAHPCAFQRRLVSGEMSYPDNEPDQRMSSLSCSVRTGGHAQVSP